MGKLKVGTSSLSQRGWLRGLLITMLVLGIGFRLLALDHKIYWHDEVYTSMRAAGYTRIEIDNQIFQNRLIPASDLHQFQQIKSGSTSADTVRSLIAEDPQHPPLYFLMARYWMHLSGSSMVATRLLPALLSLLGLPLIYGLAMELFASRLTALLAASLLALSPFDILFAQTARQYSLLTVVVIGSSWLLLRAMREPTRKRWAGYGLSVVAGLYTHPFFALTLFGQAVYVGMITEQANRFRASERLEKIDSSSKDLKQLEQAQLGATRLQAWIGNRQLQAFMMTMVAVLLLYSPWALVFLSHHGRAAATTDWTRVSVGLLYLVKLWTLSFTSLFFDLDFGFNNPITFLLRLPFLLLILAALYRIYRQPIVRTRLFILTSILVPFLILALPDLILGGKRSAVSRYLISCFPGVQLAVAHWLSTKLTFSKPTHKPIWQAVLAGCFAASILSCSVSAAAKSWWSKDLSYFNAEVIDLVNAEAAKTSPILLSDMGDDYTNMGDLISLSYGFKENVRLFLTSTAPDFAALTNETDILVFRASKPLEAAIAQQGWQLTPVSERARLWQIQR